MHIIDDRQPVPQRAHMPEAEHLAEERYLFGGGLHDADEHVAPRVEHHTRESEDFRRVLTIHRGVPGGLRWRERVVRGRTFGGRLLRPRTTRLFKRLDGVGSSSSAVLILATGQRVTFRAWRRALGLSRRAAWALAYGADPSIYNDRGQLVHAGAGRD